MFIPLESAHYAYVVQELYGLKINLLNTKCVLQFSLQLLCETLFILRRTERDMIKNVYWSLGGAPAINFLKPTVYFTYYKV